MAGSDEEAEALAHPGYWDARYTGSDGKTPSHEWFRTYNDLQPFFSKYLFESYAPETEPKILHLGAGDSVRIIRYRIVVSSLSNYENRLCHETCGNMATRIKCVWTSRPSW
jgi:hypothetical protein